MNKYVVVTGDGHHGVGRVQADGGILVVAHVVNVGSKMARELVKAMNILNAYESDETV